VWLTTKATRTVAHLVRHRRADQSLAVACLPSDGMDKKERYNIQRNMRRVTLLSSARREPKMKRSGLLETRKIIIKVQDISKYVQIHLFKEKAVVNGRLSKLINR
jgi:hypothetical protein